MVKCHYRQFVYSFNTHHRHVVYVGFHQLYLHIRNCKVPLLLNCIFPTVTALLNEDISYQTLFCTETPANSSKTVSTSLQF